MQEFEIRANKAIGNRLRRARKRRRLTLKGLGDKASVSYQLIQRYELGINGMSAARLGQLARILNMPIAYFFGGRGGRST